MTRFEGALDPKGKKPEVSLIVANYNNEAYIDECILSLKNQTFKDMEIIIVDDASSDKGVDKLKAYALEDNRIKLFLNSVRTGHPSLARNYGVSIAQGKYIAFVDSDDYLNLDCVRLHYESLESSLADIAYCNLDVYDESKNEHHPFKLNHASTKGSLVFNASNANREFWRKVRTSACFNMYKKEFFVKEELAFQDCDFEDTDVAIVAFLRAKSLCHIPKTLYVARINKKYGYNRSDGAKSSTSLADPLVGINILCHSYKLLGLKGTKGFEEGLLYAYFDLFTYFLHIFATEENFFTCIKEAKSLLEEVYEDSTKKFTYFNPNEMRFIKLLLKKSPVELMKECIIYHRANNLDVRGLLLNSINHVQYARYPKVIKYPLYIYKIMLKIAGK
ncbi:glycosyltransferase family 2 protein [Helicobacter sp. 13S00401-1]|uniref:glycosyltransferase family 2 protein n=1 Tax=Helicobacter sp. 13S00401-1 TaxID=1905758 RepID=UPI00155528F0|nr:glycosyltransferase family 2 protein [Helicobacter sp. 13S00401-1]